ncbi:MAG TPA: hypothetical protein VI454_10125 [Verrucomicrobiae bacterium]
MLLFIGLVSVGSAWPMWVMYFRRVRGENLKWSFIASIAPSIVTLLAVSVLIGAIDPLSRTNRAPFWLLFSLIVLLPYFGVGIAILRRRR